MNKRKDTNWHFIDDEGTFELPATAGSNDLYFPLVNEAGMMSCVTPTLHGDIKIGQNTFLTRPVSVEDLHESRAARNLWVCVEGHRPWSVTGSSAYQIAHAAFDGMDEESVLQAGFFWHTLTRRHPDTGLKSSVTNFVPTSQDQVELMRLTLVNEGEQPLHLNVTAAVPLFGRSADNLRDHRHVTSLLHRIRVHRHGVIVKPTLSFDERGHLKNDTQYAVLGCDSSGNPPQDIFPIQEDFRGEGGTLDWPQAVVESLPSQAAVGDQFAGYEAMGGLRFEKMTLSPGDSISYVFMLAIFEAPTRVESLIKTYGDPEKFEDWLKVTRQFWKERLDLVRLETREPRFDGWMRWVSAQPKLRQLFGNSFLPYHDYGRGGRGWRDLWQDILGLLLMQAEDVGDTLWGHFAGIRFDGSNATIIGRGPGEFKADRNDIPRVWMDHGAWPLLTTRMYLDWTGDLDFLLRSQAYFKDHLTHRSHQRDGVWTPQDGTQLKTAAGEVVQGSLLEHLLVQNLVPFFNVGEHNCILLEGGDWNDALDMAHERGESVAFTGFYAGNLADLADLAYLLHQKGIEEVAIAEELVVLLDSLFDPVVYSDPQDKQNRLSVYLDRVAHTLSGRKVKVSLQDLAADLRQKAAWMQDHLRRQEWLEQDGHGWFNGYYDDQGRRMEGAFDGCVQMTLTGQVFQLMSGVATPAQARQMVDSVQQYLYDPALHGVRLNTRFKVHTDAFGRVFGFAFGHKENGAMFSHMAVMYAYALFKCGLSSEGNMILDEIYQHCQDFPTSRMYPGLPEYLDPRGRGLYPYLTGSASWYLLTLVTRAFGVRGLLGDLLIDPALAPSRFDETGCASLRLPFAGRRLKIVFKNPQRLDADTSWPTEILCDGRVVAAVRHGYGLRIPRQVIETLDEEGWHTLEVTLTQRS